jgi:hypothetical protein
MVESPVFLVEIAVFLEGFLASATVETLMTTPVAVLFTRFLGTFAVFTF